MHCPDCNEKFRKGASRCHLCGAWGIAGSTKNAILLNEIQDSEIQRFSSGPWDECFGGGHVPATCTMIGGAPGAGKSTWILQVLDGLIPMIGDGMALYLAAEEAPPQIKARADRIGMRRSDKVLVIPCPAGGQDALLAIEEVDPAIVVVDSIQALFGYGGDFLRETVQGISIVGNFCKRRGTMGFVLSQLNKGETFSGSRSLEHDVDVTMYVFQDKEDPNLRAIETSKNRHGPAGVQWVARMTEKGLVSVDMNELEGREG